MSMQARLYRAEWVLPVVAPPIFGGELLVGEDGRIAAVAPAGALEVPTEVEVYDLGRAILLPGLVNVHAHPELSMFRGALEDLEFRDWILRLVGAKRRALRPEDFDAAARWTMIEAIGAGITTIGATESSGAAAAAMDRAGLRGIVYQEVFGPDPRDAISSVEQLERDVDRLLERAGDRVRIGISPHAPYTVSDVLYIEVVRLARSAGLPIAVHIAESRPERDLVVGGTGEFAPGLHARGIRTAPRARTPIALLESLGVLEERPLLVHCIDVDERDIETIAAADCAVAHCPIANAKLGHGVSPLPALRDAGVRVGLGSDSVASNNRMDLLDEARFATLIQRATARMPALLSPADLLRLCTLDGARALGLQERIGSLEPGKDADLCGVSIGRPHTRPVGDPIATLFHSARGSDVVLTVAGGKVVYADGVHHTLDVESVRTAIDAAAERIRDAR